MLKEDQKILLQDGKLYNCKMTQSTGASQNLEYRGKILFLCNLGDILHCDKCGITLSLGGAAAI